MNFEVEIAIHPYAFGGRKGKREMMSLYYNLKNKIKNSEKASEDVYMSALLCLGRLTAVRTCNILITLKESYH